MAARSKVWVYGRSLIGIGVSNPSGGMDVSLVNILCCTVRGLYYGPIPRPEGSYQVWFVCVCVTECEQVQQ